MVHRIREGPVRSAWAVPMDDPISLDLLRAVLDPVRLAVLGSSVGSPASIDALCKRLDVERRVVAEAIGSLRASGLLTSAGLVDELALREIARSLPPREPGLGTPVSGPWTTEEADLLGRFFADGRLVEIPTLAHKRKLVLEKIVQEFEPGHRYRERDVNFMIQLIHPDYAAIRRYLVDGGLLARADGSYWRTGGRYFVQDEVAGHDGIMARRQASEQTDVSARNGS